MRIDRDKFSQKGQGAGPDLDTGEHSLNFSCILLILALLELHRAAIRGERICPPSV